MTLTEAFSDLSDPRTGPAQRHDLQEMLVMALCAVLCGADSWVDVAEWAEDNEAWLKEYLVLERGTPSHDTFGRVFSLLDSHQFERFFVRWMQHLCPALTGELIAIDPDLGIPQLHAVVPRVHVRDHAEALQLAGERPATFVVFDILRVDGHDVTRLPHADRRALLEQLDLDRPCWHLSETFDDADVVVGLTREQGLEGVMSKRRSSPYIPGSRSPDWIKTPHRDELVAVIGGWIPEVGDERRLGALWIGHAADEETFDTDPVLYSLGRVGSGLSHKDREALLVVLIVFGAARLFGLDARRLATLSDHAIVMHPGPMNRGLEISNEIADAPASLVLNQVAAGVATRMAVLYLLATRNDGVRA